MVRISNMLNAREWPSVLAAVEDERGRQEIADELANALSQAEVLDRIDAWSSKSSEFVIETSRKTQLPEWVPSVKVVLWLAKLHRRFVDADGLGDDILIATKSFEVAS